MIVTAVTGRGRATVSVSPVASCAHVPHDTCPPSTCGPNPAHGPRAAHDHLHAYEPLHVLFRCPAAAAPSHAFATILSACVPWRAQARPRRLSATSRPAWCRVQRMPRLSPHTMGALAAPAIPRHFAPHSLRHSAEPSLVVTTCLSCNVRSQVQAACARLARLRAISGSCRMCRHNSCHLHRHRHAQQRPRWRPSACR